jgi:hypothetical protein
LTAVFGIPPISHFFGASCSVGGRIQHKSELFFVAFDKNVLYYVSCEIWIWVLYLSSEKIGIITLKKIWGSKSCRLEPHTGLVIEIPTGDVSLSHWAGDQPTIGQLSKRSGMMR